MNSKGLENYDHKLKKAKHYFRSMQKILIGSPISDYHSYCTLQYFEGLKKLKYPHFDILLVDNSEKEDFYNKLTKLTDAPIIRAFNNLKDIKEKIIKSRNLILDYFLKGNYDYFFSLEQDVIPPKDAIQRLLRHHKDIVSGVYFTEFNTSQGKVTAPLLYRFPTEEEKKAFKQNAKLDKFDEKTRKYLEEKQLDISQLELPMREEEVMGDNFLEVKMCGLGCIMIHRDVVRNIRFRCKRDDKAFDDYYFCRDARQSGFKIYADTSVKCQHLIKERSWSWDDLTKK